MEISMFNNCIKLSVASLYVWVLMFLSSYSYAQSDTFTITEDTVVDSESNPYEEADITVDGATIYLIGDYSFGNMELVNGASIEIPHDYQGSEPYIKISSRDFYLSSDSVVDVSGASYLVIPPGMPRTPEEIDFRAPEIPGSAGMTREIVVASTEPPREYENQEVRSLGGGVFVLTGRDVELHGEVAADAENIIESTGDGGSGGSIFIEGLSIKLGDNASLTAVGSPAGGLESYYGWGGDGGHVSLISGYIEGNPDSAVNVSGGRGDRNAYNPGGSGATGTLYFYENLLDIEDPEYLIIRNKRELSEYENLRAREVSVDYEGFDNIAVRNCPVRIVTGVGSEYIKVGGLIVFDGTVALNGRLRSNSIRLEADSMIRPLVRDHYSEYPSAKYTNVSIGADLVTIDNSSSINATGFGVDSSIGTPASHGGYGGYAVELGVPPSELFGDFRTPHMPGIGYSNDVRGGGMVDLDVTELHLHGRIEASGEGNGPASGGSINITTDLITFGEKSGISADGSETSAVGGGGGRVSLSYSESSVDDSLVQEYITAYGGKSYDAQGGAGSIYIENSSSGSKILIVENYSKVYKTEYNRYSSSPWASCTGVILPEPMPDLDVVFNKSCGYIELSDMGGWPEMGSPGRYVRSIEVIGSDVAFPEHMSADSIRVIPITELEIFSEIFSTTGSLSFSVGQLYTRYLGNITVSGYGDLPEDTQEVGEGGTHGGIGGNPSGESDFSPFGDPEAPVTKGRGGAGDASDSRGGGVIRIDAEDIVFGGSISANGESGSDVNTGGGAGGSIFINAQSITGTEEYYSQIGARGGSGGAEAGGGGGRIAIVADKVDIPRIEENLDVSGGPGKVEGGDGTIRVNGASEELPLAPVIVTPSTGSITNQPSIELNGHSDSQTKVRVRVNGAVQGEPVIVDDSGQFSLNVELSEGDNEMTAEAAYTNSNVYSAMSESVTVSLDTIAPEPPDLGGTDDGVYTFSTTSETHAFWAEFEEGAVLLLKGEDTGLGNGGYGYYYAEFEQGKNVLLFQAMDAAGNVSEPTKVIVYVDSVPPGPVTFVSDVEGDGTSIMLDWSSYNEEDNGDDIQEYLVFVEDDPKDTFYTYNTPHSVVPAGTKSFNVDGLSRNVPVHIAVIAEDDSGLIEQDISTVPLTPIDCTVTVFP